MSSTPFTSCSIGAATVSAMTSADAPGYVALMLTVGGTISGYSEIGSDCCAIAPAIVKISESTVAKIGRSIKKWENRIDDPISRGRLFGRQHDVARYRGHNSSRANGRIRQAGNHHAVIAGQTGRDNPKTLFHRPECHRLGFNLVIGPDRVHDLATLIGHHGRVRNQQGFDITAKQSQTPERARRQKEVLVLQHGPSADGARFAVELIVDKVHVTVSCPLSFVRQTDLDGAAGRVRQRASVAR